MVAILDSLATANTLSVAYRSVNGLSRHTTANPKKSSDKSHDLVGLFTDCTDGAMCQQAASRCYNISLINTDVDDQISKGIVDKFDTDIYKSAGDESRTEDQRWRKDSLD